jgi:hypothetical protein
VVQRFVGLLIGTVKSPVDAKVRNCELAAINPVLYLRDVVRLLPKATPAEC